MRFSFDIYAIGIGLTEAEGEHRLCSVRTTKIMLPDFLTNPALEDYMYRKEVDCGSWGWYFDDDSKLLSNVPEFLSAMMMISLQYGIMMFPQKRGQRKFPNLVKKE